MRYKMGFPPLGMKLYGKRILIDGQQRITALLAVCRKISGNLKTDIGELE